MPRQTQSQVLYYGTTLVPVTASLFLLFRSHPHLLDISSYSQASLPGLFASVLLLPIAALLTRAAVLGCADAFLKRGFKGRDLLKPWDATKEIPESAGLPASIVYVGLLFLLIPFRYASNTAPSPPERAGDGAWIGEITGIERFPHHELSLYLSTLLSLLSAIMLGFLDDVFDIRWRLKMPIPILASLPMLVVYFAGGGGTSVVVPSWPPLLRATFGGVVDLGPLYYLFMSLLSTFSVHSINILAGINGLEVGQALIISLSLCLNSALYLDPRAGQAGSFASRELRDRHLFSLSLLLPFSGCCVGLLALNRYPARVFVGDTWCYFAGQVLACAAILGHFSKTLLLFFIPQVFNFLLSCPQLFGLVPCPRHRLPVALPDGSLAPSVAKCYPALAHSAPLTTKAGLSRLILCVLETLRLVHLTRDSVGNITQTTNLTIICATLVLCGVTPSSISSSRLVSPGQKSGPQPDEKSTASAPEGSSRGSDPNEQGGRSKGPRIDEPTMWTLLMLIQLTGSAFAFAVRYWIAKIVFSAT
ncbi:hypothetical protein IE81DRAFT_145262 [Ceraceosorus guamensis]|uniref:UDP-N-acetylglucosamine--dolichyl-phosphate N-acetylglucosaminephosphotransferase n=1 Tax=Ceraceosorus guamensis TaxID=1522189 RepID=A0A316W2Y8_9BASI|nr:hypothetical protein IE81DRAFT_145262 [Ceraceosorus guamensis]PWN42025.1 hypothetical protein IE81DRAFT_145262 [Ceraceosorus guamensis]